MPVLYFFFRHIVSANQKPHSLVRDYLSQILEYSPDLQHALYGLVDGNRSLDSVSFDELWKLLLSALGQLTRIYCIADALDEMDSGNEFFLHELLALAKQRPANIKLMLTSRPVPHVEEVFRDPYILQVFLQSQLVDPDISTYVRYRVDQCEAPAELRFLIHETMCMRAAGHFLYCRLMLDDLLDLNKGLLSSQEKLLSSLESLPTPMADMYTQMLLDHSKRSGVSQELQVTLLTWATRSERPLRLLELAWMIDLEQKAHGVSKDLKALVRSACGPLLEILADETVCPIHHSFTEYLYDDSRHSSNLAATTFPVLNYGGAQYSIAQTCIRYLAFSGWYQPESQNPSKQVLPFDDSSKPNFLRLKHPFLDYAATYWDKHVCNIFKECNVDLTSGVLGQYDAYSNGKATSLLPNLDALFEDRESVLAWLGFPEPANCYDRPDPKLHKSMTSMHIAASRGLDFYVEYLIAKGQDIECQTMNKSTPIALAAARGHARVVAILLQSGAKNDEANHCGLKPLHHATSSNHYSVVKVLLDAGVDLHTPKTKENPGRRCGNARSTVGDTAVLFACESGHVETVKLFIPLLDREKLHRAFSWALYTKAAMVLVDSPNFDLNFCG